MEVGCLRIVFWSPMHGCGTTSNTLATAISFAEYAGRRVTVTQSNYCMNNLETPLLGRQKGERIMEGMGIDALVRRFKAGKLTKEQIEECSIEITPRISLIPGGRNRMHEIYDNPINLEIEKRIYEEASKSCDILMIDLNSGDCLRTTELLQEADIIVVCLRQHTGLLNEYSAHRLEGYKGKLVYLFGGYDTNSRYSVHNMTRMYDFFGSSKVYQIPYLSEFLDSINDASVLSFIRYGINLDRWKGPEGKFFSSVRKFTDGIGAMI